MSKGFLIILIRVYFYLFYTLIFHSNVSINGFIIGFLTDRHLFLPFWSHGLLYESDERYRIFLEQYTHTPHMYLGPCFPELSQTTPSMAPGQGPRLRTLPSAVSFSTTRSVSCLNLHLWCLVHCLAGMIISVKK